MRYILLLASLLISFVCITACETSGTPPTSNSPTPMPTSTTGVRLLMDTTTIVAKSDINITVQNNSTQAILFPDHQTSCTVILLQYQKGDSWDNVSDCGLGIQSTWHTLNSGASLTVKLSPMNGSWSTGLYRATLGYKTDKASTTITRIYSAQFQIN